MLLDIQNVSSHRHTSAYMYEIIESILQMHEINWMSLLGCTTDNPSTMKSLRQTIQDNYPNVTSYLCAVHVLSNLTKGHSQK
jgi:hypothetical protein